MSEERILKALANCEQGLSDTEKAQARSNIGAQGALTAGPNVDIIDNVISTEKTVVSAGSGVTITSSQEPQSRTITYTVSATGSSVSAAAPLYGTGTAADPLTLRVSHGLSVVHPSGGDTYLQVTHPVPAPGSTSAGKVLTCDDALENLSWQPPMTGVAGDSNHPNYISVDSNGKLHYAKTKRLFWEFTFSRPSVELTATDISNGFVEFVLPLGADGLAIMNNGNMICMKGYSIEMANSLNGRQMSFFVVAHNDQNTRWLMDTGFETYTETVISSYDWKAFKAIGLSADRNVAPVDAVLRVPLTTEVAGQTFMIPGYICVSVFGQAYGD